MAYSKHLLIVVVLAGGLTACDGKKTGQAEPPSAVPVTVVPLRSSEPGRQSRRMGLAQPYREQQIGFQVSGRVLSVVDVGTEVDGPVRDGGGVLVEKGGLLARLDSSRYAQRVASLELRIKSELAEGEAQRIDMEQVAQAQANLAKSTYERQLRLSQAGTSTAESLDTAKANLDVANATLKLKKAQLLARGARINELHEELRSAKLDLDDCTLRAPFTGRVTQQHIARGAFAQPGAAVVTLTLIDPISINLTLSAEDERRIVIGSPAQIYPGGPSGTQVMHGRVRAKGQVADPRTRTFQVEIMTRNTRYEVASPLSTVEKIVPVLNRYHGEPGPLYVALDAIVDADGKSFVYLINREQVLGKESTGELKPRKVEVVRGTDYWTILDWQLQEISGEGLRAEDFVVRRPTAEDARTVKTRLRQWLIRPGDLVPVSFELGRLPRGFYVPVTAVKELNGKTWVFVVEGGKAKQISVTAHESHEDRRRVEGDGLAEGARLVIKGAHYLADGALVSVQGGA